MSKQKVINQWRNENKQIAIYLTREQYEQIKRRAKADNRPMSVWAKLQLLQSIESKQEETE